MVTTQSDYSASLISHNLRRLMAREAMTYDHLITATGLDERTLRGIARGVNRPQARTLHKLANGLGVSVDDLFSPPAGMSATSFDAATNPLVNNVVTEHPHLFDNWSVDDFEELASRFGVGGQLTKEGILASAEAMNANRLLLARARVVLDSDQRQLLTEIVNLLYERICVRR